MQGRFFPALLMASSLHSVSVFAANESNDDLFTLSMEELLDVTVSVSNKTETKINLSPASVSLFSEQDIASLGVTNLIELLQHVPGFLSCFLIRLKAINPI